MDVQKPSGKEIVLGVFLLSAGLAGGYHLIHHSVHPSFYGWVDAGLLLVGLWVLIPFRLIALFEQIKDLIPWIGKDS